MRKFYSLSFLLIVFLFFTAFFKEKSSKPLPNWIDPAREKSDRMPPIQFGRRTPPSNFRVPAEYEPIKAITMGFAGYSSMLIEIAQIASTHGNAEVWAAEGPSFIEGVPKEKYFNSSCKINTVWMRDYGPFGILEGTNEIGIIDTIYRHYSYRRDDDKIPTCMGEEKNISSYAMPLIYDGGNFMIDTEKNLFMTKRIYNWNADKSENEVNSLIEEYFNVGKIHAFDYAGYPGYPADGTGHIDMFLKLLDDETILVAETADEPFKTASEKAISYFNSIKTPAGNNYKIVGIPGWQSDGTWYTYTNSLIINDVVIIPGYASFGAKNKMAEEIYQKAMPGKIIKSVNSDNSITSGGSIHCLTQQIPKL